MRIAVAGGTGVAGRHVMSALHHAAHDPVVLARSTGVDLSTGEGLERALQGVVAVVDVSNIATANANRSRAFFDAATGHLLAAGARAGVAHHVALSIVGADRVPGGYYAGQLVQERLVQRGATPWTVLRATQFHEFTGQILARTRGPVAVVPRMRTRPVAAREVADALVELATGSAQGLAPELAGPEEQELVDLCRQILRSQGSQGRVLPVPLPGRTGWAMRNGALLPTVPGRQGHISFHDWLHSPSVGAHAHTVPGPTAAEAATT